MTIVAGMSASLPLTPGATGEPFSAAAIMSSAPAEGGTATLSGAPNYLLTFASSPVFSGTVIVTYTLTGPGGVSDPATVTITVTTRPDPSDDPEVAGLLNAQAQAVQQFAAGQTDNINHRMGALRSEACRKAFANGLELSGQGADGNAASVQTDPIVGATRQSWASACGPAATSISAIVRLTIARSGTPFRST
ncbi:MAG: hypothetical protein EOR94_19490 [Mesorhizobium sp.]|nr:MAG: hypothetical protein EOR94_19490 [Mesorhizobium sp.]